MMHLIIDVMVQRTEATVEFRLDGSLADDVEEKIHKCELDMKVETAPDLSPVGKEAPHCTRLITTHSGAFEDPCTVRGIFSYMHFIPVLITQSS